MGTFVHFDTLSIPIRYPISEKFAASFTTNLATSGRIVESVGRLQHEGRLTWKSSLNRSKAKARLERTDDRIKAAAGIPGGATNMVVRIVTENSRTLKFDVSGFEGE